MFVYIHVQRLVVLTLQRWLSQLYMYMLYFKSMLKLLTTKYICHNNCIISNALSSSQTDHLINTCGSNLSCIYTKSSFGMKLLNSHTQTHNLRHSTPNSGVFVSFIYPIITTAQNQTVGVLHKNHRAQHSNPTWQLNSITEKTKHASTC